VVASFNARSEAAMTLPKSRNEYIEGFLSQIAYGQLSPAVAEVVRSIEEQFRRKGHISNRQYEVLRKCSVATNGSRLRNGGVWSRYYSACRG